MIMVRENNPSSRRSYLMKPQTQMVALLLSASLFAPAHAEVYKWADKEGGLHYSELPPANVKYEIVSPRYAAPLNPAAEPKSEQASGLNMSGQEKQQQEQQKAEAEKIRLQNCFTVQKNLDGYESAARISIKNPDGTVQRLTEEERQAKIAEMQELVKKYCD